MSSIFSEKNYENYFRNFYRSNPIHSKINSWLEQFLIKKGKEKELSNKFNELKKTYYDANEIVITEFNKYLLKRYASFLNEYNT